MKIEWNKRKIKNKKKESKPLIIYLPGAISTCSNNTLALFKSLWIIPSSWIDAIPAEISLFKWKKKKKKKGFVDFELFFLVLKEKKRKKRKRILCKFHSK